MDEKQIVRLCQNGRHEYYETLIVRYETPLYRYCFHLCGNPEDSKDLFQETWLKAISKLGTYDENYSFKNWLMAIASNSFRDRYRKKVRRAAITKNYYTTEAKVREFENIASNEVPADNALVKQEEKAALKAEVSRLKWHYKVVIILHYYEEQSLKDISSILKIPVGTVKSRLGQARKILKERIRLQSE